ncbi:hypothetical protein BDV36DRAFT_58432 [Aspergillus pseudocaelatus]|uniref:Uncharacterized protein n=1 Tax=Aspergillus pseudocaelatus TaxID=1825620 RepID=A0ABQ6W5P4_9EURO|nr:hypothetical protein BDV36DRAFT_58432 [Aspergillus pseudocaelatus]
MKPFIIFFLSLFSPYSFFFLPIPFSLVLLLDICVTPVLVACNDKYKKYGGIMRFCFTLHFQWHLGV